MYYEINEELCKRGHEQNHLITDYKPGSTTASYRAAVDAFAAKCEAAKQGCRPGHEAKLDALADRYARRLAAYYNNSAANNARHVSWFVAGPSNYNMRAHEKWSRREEKLREALDALQVGGYTLSMGRTPSNGWRTRSAAPRATPARFYPATPKRLNSSKRRWNA